MEYKQRILIVDDKEANLFALRNVLKELGVEVVQTNNGNDALIATLNYDFALAILDVQMPEMDGYELAEFIRNEPQTKLLPIIFLSAIFSDDFHVFKGYQSGAVDFLTKPFKPEILLSKVRVFLELDRQRHEVQKSYNELRTMLDAMHLLNKQLQEQAEMIDQKGIEIDKKNKNITASINYAKRIQEAILPQRSEIKALLPDFFMLYQPKEVVSGDFYWIGEADNKIITAAVDCTGHGVPGAFMSLISNDLLHDIVDLMGITEPDKILNLLQKEVNIALSQAQTENQDGMDIAICLIDKENKTLEFAGARNSLFYIQNGVLNELKGDKLSIGGNWKKSIQTSFTKQTIPIYQGNPTFCYLCSDGFQDQFSPQGKKFTKTRFKELLLQVHLLDMEAQGEAINQMIGKWQGAEMQTDDRMVFGFCLPPFC
jgi:phosphoserine phosphatase RsbU/P